MGELSPARDGFPVIVLFARARTRKTKQSVPIQRLSRHLSRRNPRRRYGTYASKPLRQTL